MIPPQFDTYGKTFWIPSQVEPTVALIGTSLPAIRQSLVSAALDVSKVWSQMSFSLASRAKQGSSGVGGSVVRWTSPRSKVLHVSEQKLERASNNSQIGLHTEYYELRDRNDDTP